METSVALANQLLASGNYKIPLSLLKGFRNGAVYGAKVRAPHSLVMTLLFKGGTVKEILKTIFDATFTHSSNLAMLVFLYKSSSYGMEWLQSQKKQYHSFLAAFCAGYLIFGRYNKVNEQVNLYLLSRILYALAKLAVKRGYIPEPKQSPFPWFAAFVWGTVLWLFEYEKDTLQASLRSSMTYLYHDSNMWHNIRDFLIYNK